MNQDEKMFDREISERERIRSLFAEGMVHGPDGKSAITSDWGDLQLITLLERMAKRIASTDEAPTLREDLHGRSVCTPTPLGGDLVRLCTGFDQFFPRRHQHHVFNPWIKVMVVACGHWCGMQGFGQPAPGIGIVPEDEVALNRIVRFVRRVCHSTAFKWKVANVVRLALQNFRSVCAYFVWLFTLHSRLLILRVDLYYRGKGKWWAYSGEADAAFDRFMRALRESRIIPTVLGYVASREEGPERGIHFHLLVAMDGHKYKDARGFADQIGKAWAEKYSGPGMLGSFFNCYSRRGSYPFNGLGLVHVRDWRKLIGLRAAIRYITKPDYQVKVKSDSERNLRRGLIRATESKLGAPRKARHSMAKVLRILGPAASPDRTATDGELRRRRGPAAADAA
ncbi:MAG: inovirus-type Gp2 protein [Xanthomonadales bacterium]|nr:inovirus-type Gp2 protein [Xanthomonadales bacterium]